MKHAHYDKMVAFAGNKHLVLFAKDSDDSDWYEIAITTKSSPSFHEDAEYFPCLPKHKEVVLNFLNGGESECRYKHESEWGIPCSDKWNEMHWYMQEDCHSRIKPKEEKITPLNIPWDSIDKQYNYTAMDSDGGTHLFKRKPFIEGSEWVQHSNDVFKCVRGVFVITTKDIDWKLSLTKRPDIESSDGTLTEEDKMSKEIDSLKFDEYILKSKPNNDETIEYLRSLVLGEPVSCTEVRDEEGKLIGHSVGYKLK